MGGIFGYAGNSEALPYLLGGLKKLSHHGQDGAGVALLSGGKLIVRKVSGPIDGLVESLRENPISGTVGIGHVRRAAHGEPTALNAHPQTDSHGHFAVVQNGTLVNSAELRSWLATDGYQFVSGTDTEVVAHLLARFWRGDFRQAVREVLPHLRGDFALAMLCRDAPDMVCCVRHGISLSIGVSARAQFVSSDIQALLPYTKDVVFLKNLEIAMLTREGCAVYSDEGRKVSLNVEKVEWARETSQDARYESHMLKEITEQPAVLRAVLDAYVGLDDGRLVLRGGLPDGVAGGVRRLWLIGSGSSYHAAVAGKLMIERIARIPVEADVSSEFVSKEPLLLPGDACLFISASGETADTLAAQRLAAGHAPTYALTAAPGCALARAASHALYTHTGPESAVAATKGYTAQVLVLSLLALKLAAAFSVLSAENIAEALSFLSQIPAQAEKSIRAPRDVQRFASLNAVCENVFFIGMGPDWALALEASMKLREVARAQSEAFAAGELRHGGIALVTQGTLVIALVTREELLDAMILSMREVKARGGKVLAVTKAKMRRRLSHIADEIWSIPDAEPICTPVLGILQLQLFAYYMALARGMDVDHARNLAKTI